MRAEEAAFRFYRQLFQQWPAALRAEAAVRVGRADTAYYLTEATRAVAGNPVAEAIAARAHALASADPDALLATARSFADSGCPYQHARTLVLVGGERGAEGAAELAVLGATPTSGAMINR